METIFNINDFVQKNLELKQWLETRLFLFFLPNIQLLGSTQNILTHWEGPVVAGWNIRKKNCETHTPI